VSQLILAGFVVCLGVAVPAQIMAAVRTHPVDPAEAAGAPYAVRANGLAVPLERAGSRRRVYYARFHADGPVDVSIRVRDVEGLRATIEPRRLAKNVRTEGSTVRFVADVAGPRVVRISAGGEPLPLLFVIRETAERFVPDPQDPTVLNVADYGATPGPEPQTAKLQRALDDCAARPGGGIVFVPPGRYLTGTLRIRSHTYLYLAGGAVLQAVQDPKAFPVDPGRTEHGGNGRIHSFSRVLLFDRACNAGLLGRGTVDGAGVFLRNEHNKRVQIIDAHACRNLLIEGVVLRNTASWTMHLLASNNVRVADVKIIADWDVGNADGIDPDSCRNVLIERVFCYTGDDSIAIKTTGNSDLLQSSCNILVRDSVVMTRKTGLKIGTETLADVQNVLFENIDIVHSSRGIGLWVRDGGHVGQVTFRDIRMDLVEIPGESRSGQPFLLTLQKRGGVGRLQDVRFVNITCRAPWFSLLESSVEPPVERITFENVTWRLAPRVLKRDRKHLFELRNAREIAIRGLRVDWSDAQPQLWAGLWAADAPIKAQNVVEVPPPLHEPKTRPDRPQPNE